MRYIRALFLGIVGWFLLSVCCALPRELCMPLPQWMHTYKTSFYSTGYTYTNGLVDLYGQNAAPGSFSALKLHENNNLPNKTYVNGSKVYFQYKGAGRELDLDSGEMKEVVEKDSVIKIDLEECSVALTSDEIPRLYHKGAFYGAKNWDMFFNSYSKKEGFRLSIQNVVDVVLQSEEEGVAYREISGLLQYAYQGFICGYYPEEHVLMLKMYDEEGNKYIYRCHTDQKEGSGYVVEEFGPYPYELVEVVSGHEILAYVADMASVVQLDLITGEQTTIIDQLPALTSLHFGRDEQGNLVCGGIISKQELFLKYTGQEAPIRSRSEEGFFIHRMAFTEDGVVLLSIPESGAQYMFRSHEAWKGEV